MEKKTLNDVLLCIRPSEDQLKTLSGIMLSIANTIRNQSQIKIKEINPSGSYGKNTILRDHLEIDCVYIVEKNNWNYLELMDYLFKILNKSSLGIKKIDKKHHSINISINKKIGNISVDIIPTYEINSPKQMTEVKDIDSYIGSTSYWHKKYIKVQVNKNPNYIDIVRLMKYWKYQKNITLSSFALELITASSLEILENGPNYLLSIRNVYRTIQSFLDGKGIYPVNWEKYFKNNEISAQKSKNGLLLVDPANPSDNLAKKMTKTEIKEIQRSIGKAMAAIENGDIESLFKKESVLRLERKD
jgi:tRNA nucleotidyltransferase (CCA-adding enzyme)